jgi:hypothetical protein
MLWESCEFFKMLTFPFAHFHIWIVIWCIFKAATTTENQCLGHSLLLKSEFIFPPPPGGCLGVGGWLGGEK